MNTQKYFITCGCSFSCGIYQSDETTTSKIKNYSDFLQELTLNTYKQKENLSISGGSNYSIVKQIEYAITLNPDLIIFNTTTARRYEFISDFNKNNRLSSMPSLLDFRYLEPKLINFEVKNKIRSISIRKLEFLSKSNYIYKKIFDCILMHEDEMINLDKNALFIKSAIYSLEKEKIPFICLDFGGILNLFDHQNVIKLSWNYMYSNYKIDNFGHFNEDGHEYIANIIIEKLKNC